jgi:thiamine-monophosphate kinase
MAAKPEAVFVALALPRDASCLAPHAVRRSDAGAKHPASSLEQYVRLLYSGIESVCAETGCEVAGGDTIVSDRLLLALTVTGKSRWPKLRSGAKPGDRLYVTGCLGSAEAGRLLLVEGARSRKRGSTRRRWQLPLVRRHLRPEPRLATMQALRSCIHGLIDTSDGLATDARHIAEMSGVRIELDAGAIPIESGTRRFCAEHGLDTLDFVLRAGEDYELLFTSQCRLPRSVKGVKLTLIGRVEKGRGLWIEHSGRALPVTAKGYDHLRSSANGKTCW